jgi:hypothetical protein
MRSLDREAEPAPILISVRLHESVADHATIRLRQVSVFYSKAQVRLGPCNWIVSGLGRCSSSSFCKVPVMADCDGPARYRGFAASGACGLNPVPRLRGGGVAVQYMAFTPGSESELLMVERMGEP